MSVFVLDINNKPLLPTCEARARILLKKNRATVYSVEPFTIKLNKTVDKPIGNFKLGIDDGSKYVGISIGYNSNVIFSGTIKLRQDVHKLMLQRSQFRRSRRIRKLRYRKVRFLNRGRKNWLPPTIRQKKDSILRVIDDLKKRINITECIIEQGKFDINSLSVSKKLYGDEYQISKFEGNNFREKILWRDKYICQKCRSKNNLVVHHILSRLNGGSNSVNNGITLCKNCHNNLHQGKFKIIKNIKQFKYPTHLHQGKNYLFDELSKRFKTFVCFGWMTSQNRKILNLEKTHYNDACAIINCNNFKCYPYIIIPKRTKNRIVNVTKKCEEKNGFRHWDVIRAYHKTKGIVIGSILALCEKQIAIRTSFSNNFQVSYSKSKLIYRPNRIVYFKY